MNVKYQIQKMLGPDVPHINKYGNSIFHVGDTVKGVGVVDGKKITGQIGTIKLLTKQKYAGEYCLGYEGYTGLVARVVFMDGGVSWFCPVINLIPEKK